MLINNKQLTKSAIDEAKQRRFIAVNEGGAEMITAPNIHALNLGPLTYLTPKAVDILTQPMTFDSFVGGNRNIKE